MLEALLIMGIIGLFTAGVILVTECILFTVEWLYNKIKQKIAQKKAGKIFVAQMSDLIQKASMSEECQNIDLSELQKAGIKESDVVLAPILVDEDTKKITVDTPEIEITKIQKMDKQSYDMLKKGPMTINA